MLKTTSIAACAAMALLPIAAGASTITDGDFASWTTVEVFNYVPSTGNYAGSVYTTAGNPGVSFLSNVINGIGVPGVRAANINNNYSSNDLLSGAAWTMEFDASNGPTGTPYQGIGLALRQGNNYWISGAQVVPSSPGASGTNWTHYSVNGTFNANAFVQIMGADAMDLSGATATSFGFFAYVQGGYGSPYQLLIDNYSLTSTNLSAPVPEPASWLMLAAGGLGLAAWRRRKG